ncbi:ester cyclase [Lysobacter niastensis]|nr:ester cyclase [Lysobacter niastensis]
MKTYNILLSAVATIVALTGVMPCGANASDGVRAESVELNKSITRRVYEEGLNQGRFEVPYSADFVGHGGRATFTHAHGMAEARGWREAFPDLKITVDKQVAERDLVAVRWTARGTNTGAGNGVPATGRAVQVTGTTLFRVADGRIAEEWTCADSLGVDETTGHVADTRSDAGDRRKLYRWCSLTQADAAPRIADQQQSHKVRGVATVASWMWRHTRRVRLHTGFACVNVRGGD